MLKSPVANPETTSEPTPPIFSEALVSVSATHVTPPQGVVRREDHSNTAIGTLVERWSRYVMLSPLPDGKDAESVRTALEATVQRLPEHLWESLTWDQGKEMAQHAQFTVATGVQVDFCDPKSPWQRGTNENTNGLLRQYFPKGTDLSIHSQHDLDQAAYSLNGRPRRILGWMTPSDKLAEALQ
jgi:IS30 family transposase